MAAKNAKQQVLPPQWSAASFQMPAHGMPQQATMPQQAVQQGKGQPRGGQIIGARPGKGAPTGPANFQSTSSFSFFKLPPNLPEKRPPTPQQAGLHQFSANAASFNSSFNLTGPTQMPADAPLAHCASYASCNSNDAQEELNLHPSLNKLKKPSPFEADATSILYDVMGSALASGVPMPVNTADRSQRTRGQMQRTESQLIMAQAQAMAMQEQRRRTNAQAMSMKAPSPIHALLQAKPVPQKIYLMRHGESEANISRRDVPDPNLTNLGLAQAKSWQETIGDLMPDIILVSPLRRALQTCLHAFAYEEVPIRCCRFAREIGWSCNENTIHSTADSMEKMLDTLPRGDEVEAYEEALIKAHDDPATEMDSLQRLKVVLAGRPETTIVVVCHFGVIAALSGCRAKNGDIYECEWGLNDELRVLQRHKTPLADQQCICG